MTAFSNAAKRAAVDGSLGMTCVKHVLSDVDWLLDYWDRSKRGTADERQLLRDIKAQLTSLLTWVPGG